MYKEHITIGVAPTKRGFLSMTEAKRQKDIFMKVIRSIKPEAITLVDLDDICENGIAYQFETIQPAVDKFTAAKIDALFVPFCDFGEEQVAAGIASAMKVPTLLWGARDEVPNTDASRGRDTQCGMFAASKVLLRHGVKFSYIYNIPAETEEFRNGFETFARAAAVVKCLKGLRIAKIGARPQPFLSVITDEGQLISKLGVTTVPISPAAIITLAKKLVEEKDPEFEAYYRDVTGRIDFSRLDTEKGKLMAAVKVAIQQLMKKNACTVGALDCWSGFGPIVGFPPCLSAGELADLGYPLACECDVNGAVTLAMARAVALGDTVPFFADLTIRHPENDNAELLWHCGPFPYSLKDPDSPAWMSGGNERFRLKKGDITILRFDDLNGKYYMFTGEGKAVDGPETTGTYVYFQTENWKRWEEKLMFGPYIHHVAGIYGKFARAFEEAARYLPDTIFDGVNTPGPTSL
ncbi:MAG: L-fucose/L-arabinose isomerase family protein [Christensenellales bacterium]|jgi:L-fucose isomerase-like protein